MFFAVLGWLALLAGGVVFLIAAFRTGPGWGLSVLFLPFANVVYLFRHWDEARRGFQIQVLGVSLVLTGLAIGLARGTRTAMLPLWTNGGDAVGVAFQADPGVAPPPVASAVTESDGGIYVGKTLHEVEDELGSPRAVLKVGGRTTVFYPGLELVAEDGDIVTGESTAVTGF